MTPPATTYEHKHFGTVIVWVLVSAVAFLVWLALWADLPDLGQLVLLVVTALMVFALFLFRSLSVRVDAEAVSVWFGPGWPRTRVALLDIEDVEVVQKSWLWGFGIRWTPRGWLWRASGLRAVEIRCAGHRSLFVGTDEPEALADAIRAAKA